MGTNVPAPSFTPQGYQAPSTQQVLEGVIEDWTEAYGLSGFDLNLDAAISSTLTTPQGQLAQSETAVIDQVNTQFVTFSNLIDPAYTFGRYQDAIGRIYFISRIPATPTIIQVACLGGVGVPIPVGATVQDGAGNIYSCTQAASIPSSGTITLPFQCIVPGGGVVPIPESVEVYQNIPGWDTATFISGVMGSPVESRAAFEIRRGQSVAVNAQGWLAAVVGAVLSVPGVIDVYATENDTDAPQTIGGITLAANSIYVAVIGGEAAAVARAIWTRKAPGCAYNGNTTVDVYDTNPLYTPPYPKYSVSFETPTPLPFLFVVNMVDNTLVPSNALTLVQQGIINAFAGLDGGPRARIGALMLASRYYSTVAALWPGAQVISILIGSTNASGAVFAGSISGTTLTVTSVSAGTIAIGQSLFDTSGDIIPGTLITAGSGTSWTVNNSQTVALETISAVSASLSEVSVNINQVPSVAAGNISLNLS